MAVGIVLGETRMGDMAKGLPLLPRLAKYGGFVMTSQITGWNFAHEKEDLFRLAREFADNRIVNVKANGNRMHDTPGADSGAAEMFAGLWLSDAMAQWGWHPENFLMAQKLESAPMNAWKQAGRRSISEQGSRSGW